MKKIWLLWLIGLASTGVASAEDMIHLDIEILVDEERISSPAIALKPGSDGTIMQGIEPDIAMKVAFHSTHASDDGAEMMVDIDFGLAPDPGNLDRLEHVRTHHGVMPWGIPFEVAFQAKLDSPVVRIVVTPTRVKHEDMLLRAK